MAYIHVYRNSPTAGGTDGQAVSEGDQTNPIVFGPLNADNNEESVAATLALRCDSGYHTSGNVIIALTGSTASKMALSADGTTWGAYGDSLVLSSMIGAVNTLFYAKSKATAGETPIDDTAVKFAVSATITPV